MKKFLATLLVVGSMFFSSTVNAEIQTYTGVGEYLMSDFETFDVAQQRAKQRAEQNACEQAGVFVESRTEVQNAQVTRDEIITMTSGILKIVDVQFKREFVNDNTTRIHATITANIDSNDINQWLSKGTAERSSLVAQNEELRRANAEQDKQIAALKQQLADVKTQQDRERLTQKFATEDKIFLSNRKYEEGINYYWHNNLNGASELFTQAIEINPDNFLAYGVRGTVYYHQRNYTAAINDFNRAIQIDPNWIQMYLLIAYSYYSLNDYGMALENLTRAIHTAKNFSLDRKYGLTRQQLIAVAYYNRGRTYQALGDYGNAQADFMRAQQFGYRF